MMRSLWSSSKLLISSVLTGSLLLGGCASTGSSMVDPRLTQSSDAQFFSKSGLSGLRHGGRYRCIGLCTGR